VSLPDPQTRVLIELRAARLARGMTQLELAQRVRLSRPQYSALETGRSVVNLAQLHDLSVVLAVRFMIGEPSLLLASRLVTP
jgi:transcriptional regulator with XRE-family HTH domain